ncbi:methionyl-tRNA formyltransferase [Planosporangium mesophilum]|uniref:Methionyl-tRNA formyltransferase n=1 Tax=Planosporangium mesophilum TaxID=689768 RepID=A0A8J3X536_9ACTN|nr:methionyl-tRNA formyltransferase [Planosporangium mesophilum]NJC85233.1 methionyl-tRNA formyltransferase [Planosporangium mesophilum]GII24378.1 methionyl-tRNA formyltransferase [Planosporangium mesophilum]
MRLVFAGTPAVALPALDAIAASGHDLVAVVTRPDAPAGRGRQLHRSPVGAWADERGIEVLTPQRPREPEFLDRLREIAPDCVPVVAYGALVPPAALEIPRHGWVNLHFSLLPAWRGAAPVQHAILHGDELTGASVFGLEEGLDTGPVYGTLTEPIKSSDDAGELLDRLSVAGAGLLVSVLDGIGSGTLEPVPQPHEGVTLAPKVTVEDAAVRWGDPAFAVDRRIRACTPNPGAWTTFRGERVKLGPVTVVPGGPRLHPGELLVERGRVLAGTATDPVALGEVRAAGKKPMPADAWARGVRPDAGERVGADGGA